MSERKPTPAEIEAFEWFVCSFVHEDDEVPDEEIIRAGNEVIALADRIRAEREKEGR